MKKQSPLRFLSNRAKLLGLGLCAVALFLLGAYGAALSRGAPLWPVLVAVAMLAALGGALYGWFMRPYERLERMIRLFLEGYTISAFHRAGDVALSPISERLLGRMHDELNAPYLLKLSKRQAQYRTLQNQINPHFLYNTLESIRSEALMGGLTSVAEMTEALAVFFRYTISKVENLVSVEEELQNCETYFRIQQYRFGARLQLRVECPEEDREEIYACRLPKLTLQPILENSIIHGTEFKIGVGHLLIHLESTRQRLLIRISDDGVGMDEATLARLNERLGKSGQAFQDERDGSKGGLALMNVNNRIHLLFGEEYGLHVYSMEGVGTDVEITLPLIASDRDIANREVLR